MIHTYFIGGSPCSGKSTIADILSERYHLYYFKVDDYLEEFTQRGASKGFPICQKQLLLNQDQIWMRDPILQCEEELVYYNEIFEFVIETLQKLPYDGIITEGAAYLPNRMKDLQVPNHHYLALTPSKDFQLYHYAQREWVPYVLGACKDPKQAFSNWMERDHLFSQAIQIQCYDANYISLINDGNRGIDDLLTFVINHFRLGDE